MTNEEKRQQVIHELRGGSVCTHFAESVCRPVYDKAREQSSAQVLEQVWKSGNNVADCSRVTLFVKDQVNKELT
jgi:hypothetical protein